MIAPAPPLNIKLQTSIQVHYGSTAIFVKILPGFLPGKKFSIELLWLWLDQVVFFDFRQGVFVHKYKD
jgi:hypothetical protein